MNRYTHCYPGLGNTRVALAIVRRTIATGPSGEALNTPVEYTAVGVAFCSKRDQFNRKKGRLIAEGRARGNSKLSFHLPGHAKLEQILGHFRALVRSGTFGPQWAAKEQDMEDLIQQLHDMEKEDW